MNYRNLIVYLGALCLAVGVLLLPHLVSSPESTNEDNVLRVMTYASFLQDWGAGPILATKFEEETGIKIRWINAGHAGLLIERLKFKGEIDRPDLIMGFDQFSIQEARLSFNWLDIRDQYEQIEQDILPKGARFHDFLAYDWGPMTFVYRKGEVEPPHSLDDLIKPEFFKKIILQDPRMSSPGLQFLFWVLSLKGEREGFDFLKKLKPSIFLMTSSWSNSYSLFRSQPGRLVFSYFSSPFYHQIEEKDSGYQAATFSHPHPVQVEYVGIPQSCIQCDWAKKFAGFLLRPDIQKIVMKKNYMFPVENKALEGEVIQLPENIQFYDPIESFSLLNRKRQLVNQWKKVFY